MSSSSPSVLVVHGPNLNLLGEREPDIYGHTTLEQLDASLVALGEQLGVTVSCAQANGEGAVVELVQSVRGSHSGLVINPGGYTHTSVAVHDALRSLDVPVIEVHLSNLYARESFRHESVTGGAATGVVMGLGTASYELAVRHLATLLNPTSST